MFSPVAEQGRPLRTSRVHHRADIVHAAFEIGEFAVGNGVGQSSAALVEHDQSRERREPPEESGQARLLPHDLHVGDPSRYVDQVERTRAHHLVGDVHAVAHGVKRLWAVHARILPRAKRDGNIAQKVALGSASFLPYHRPTRCAA
jgi:hypothetical protein